MSVISTGSASRRAEYFMHPVSCQSISTITFKIGCDSIARSK